MLLLCCLLLAALLPALEPLELLPDLLVFLIRQYQPVVFLLVAQIRKLSLLLS